MTTPTQKEKIISYKWKYYKLVPTETGIKSVDNLVKNTNDWFYIFMTIVCFMIGIMIWFLSASS